MVNQYHFRSSIDPEQIERRIEARGCESKAEYFRLCIREEMQRGQSEVKRGDR